MSHASIPVRGSSPVADALPVASDGASLSVEPAEVLGATAVAPLPELGLLVVPLLPLAAPELVDEPDEPEVPEPPDEEPEEPELVEPDEPDPPNGSAYWSSPAPPWASAGAGAAARVADTSRQTRRRVEGMGFAP